MNAPKPQVRVWQFSTSAAAAGADEKAIQDALTHSNAITTRRYVRRRSKKIADVAEARKLSREATGES